MAEIATPRDLFLHELGDILDVERRLSHEVLPMLVEEVQDKELRQALEQHLRETKGHVKNVEKVFDLLGETPQAETCIGFQGLKSEHEKLRGETAEELVDSVDLGAAARTECYEIAAYEGLRRMAKAMDEDRAVELLDRNLAEEKEALRLVGKIATRVSKESARSLA